MNSIPFTAALFDLDGTLLDSHWVWREVDRAFFEGLGIPEPPDYAPAIQGMSFRETAAYTVRRFRLDRTVEELMEGWTRTTARAYAERVQLKPGALAYLRGLKRAGVRLAIATANREELFGPALRRCGAWELFDVVCTSAQVGHVGKGDGSLFRLAAQQLGAAPEDCAVFEDTLEGIRGAKAAGMRAYALREESSAHCAEQIARLADGVLEDFTRTEGIHPPLPRGRCVIFTARCDGDLRRAYSPRPGDFVLCADAGWQLARAAGVRPDLVIGDFDSSDAPKDVPSVRVPAEKDDTDTLLCLKHGLRRGYDDFWIAGGLGGRPDHALANLQSLRFAAGQGARAVLCDGINWATVLTGGSIRVPRDVLGPGPVKLSVFALDEICRGVTIRGAKWQMEEGTLSNAFPLGVSNEFTGECAEIAVREGGILVIVCAEGGRTTPSACGIHPSEGGE